MNDDLTKENQTTNASRKVVTIDDSDIISLAMSATFDPSIKAVIEVGELSFETDPRLKAALEVNATIDINGGDGFWVGYPSSEEAHADIERWDEEGLIASDDILNLWERGADGKFAYKDQC